MQIMCVLPLSGKSVKPHGSCLLQHSVPRAGSTDFLLVPHTDQPCSHLSASAPAVASARNALLMAVGKACSFPLPRFQQKHHLFREHSLWAPIYCFYLITMFISFPASGVFTSPWSVSPWERKFHEGRDTPQSLFCPQALAQHLSPGHSTMLILTWIWCLTTLKTSTCSIQNQWGSQTPGWMDQVQGGRLVAALPGLPTASWIMGLKSHEGSPEFHCLNY